jgi:hypothetical protein
MKDRYKQTEKTWGRKAKKRKKQKEINTGRHNERKNKTKRPINTGRDTEKTESIEW